MKTEHQAVTGGIFYCRDSAYFSVSASNKLSCKLTGQCFEIGNKNIPPIRYRSGYDDTIRQEMKRLLKIFLTLIILSGLTAVWYWADKQDYFQGDYPELTDVQNIIFKWQDGDDGDKLMTRYKQHFADTEFVFPRQKGTKVKLFKNIPIIGVFTGKTLKQNYIETFLKFCNDTANFDWGETTWGISESEYYVRLYNSDNKVIGKIYFCLDECGMTSAKPFCPAMKFGGLSATGLDNIKKLINKKNNWE